MRITKYESRVTYLEVDPGETVVINGLAFVGEFFTMFAESQIGTVVEIVNREDGVLRLREIRRNDGSPDQ